MPLISRVVNRATPGPVAAPVPAASLHPDDESLTASNRPSASPAGTPVLTSPGVGCIEDVTAGDEVLTHRGRYREVLRLMVRRQADEPGVIYWWYDKPLMSTLYTLS